jgi:hypothetical protein
LCRFKVDEVNAPWPAFVFVGNPAVVSDAEFVCDVRNKLFPALAEGISLFTAIVPDNKPKGSMSGSSLPNFVYCDRICTEHNFQENDARLWLSRCKYAVPESNTVAAEYNKGLFNVNKTQFELATKTLSQAKLVPSDFNATDLWTENRIARISDNYEISE